MMCETDFPESYTTNLFTGAGDGPMENVSHVYWRYGSTITHPKFCLYSGKTIGGYIDFVYLSAPPKVAPINLYGIVGSVDNTCSSKRKHRDAPELSFFARLFRACLGRKR